MNNNPIYIVGCSHSGTSILLTILGRHSNIYAIPYESNIGFSSQPQNTIKDFYKQALNNNKNRWVEKTPSHIRAIGRLIGLRKGSKVLLIIRDGRDVALSIKNRNGSLERGITQWVKDNTIGKKFWNYESVLVLRYEDLVKKFDKTIQDVLLFLGERYEKSLDIVSKPIRYYHNTIQKPSNAYGSNHRQYRNWQLNQPLFDGSGKWKSLTKKEINIIHNIGGDSLKEMGYV